MKLLNLTFQPWTASYQIDAVTLILTCPSSSNGKSDKEGGVKGGVISGVISGVNPLWKSGLQILRAMLPNPRASIPELGGMKEEAMIYQQAQDQASAWSFLARLFGHFASSFIPL